jgi:tetratricopeptide (TPR) repeat protein
VVGVEKNAVELRLEHLNKLWEAFSALPEARLLRWLADAESRQVIDVFIELHKNDPAGIPDLFLTFDVPFRDETSYAADVVRFWRGWFDENRDDLIEESIDPTWVCPQPRAGERGPAFLQRVALSFQAKYGEDFRHLAIILAPKELRDPAAWSRWLAGLVSAEIPPAIRYLVVEDAESPALTALAEGNPKRIVTQTPEFDTTQMYRELLRSAGGSGPGAAFRDQYVGMLLAAKSGNVAAALAAGATAIAVAGGAGWSHLQAAAQLGVAGILGAAGKPADAIAGYRQAAAFGEAALKAGEPTGLPLIVQSRMAEAGTLFAQENYSEAAGLYEKTAPQATEADDHLLAMENWRMAAACREQTGEFDKAWASGEQALKSAALIDPEMRPNTTLPFAGRGLLRLAGKPEFAKHKDRIVKTMNVLAGPGWEDRHA